MPSFERKTLAVVGAGPKGIAVAVKAKVLEEFGLAVDRVILIEKHEVAAHWSGDFGYTNGEMKLGTSPEKDVVFPLETDVKDERLNERIRQRLLQFSWASFLVQTQRYSDWVDRGRPSPCHRLWARYLRWVSEQLEPQTSVLKAEVVGIDLSEDGSRWELALRGSDSRLSADRLMLTGPGQTRTDFVARDQGRLPPGTYDLESFWGALEAKSFSPAGRIAIVGAGENAASALLALSQYAPKLRVDVISPRGFISTRAESFYENQVYSQPERNRWDEMEFSDRINFIERTDLGVFSTHAMNILNDQVGHQIVAGRVVGLCYEDHLISIQLEYGSRTSTRIYDQVILANGFDPISLIRTMLLPKALMALEKSIGVPLNQQKLASLVQTDLSVKGMSPSLHLPMLAGLMQGPGFGNLSCLGRLSDRIVVRDTGVKTRIPSRSKTFSGMKEAVL